MASPKTNPVITGSDRKDEMNPSRSNPARRKMAPTETTSAASMAGYWSGLSPMTGAMTAAIMMEVEEVAATASWRLVPKMAKRGREKISAYSPAWAGAPAIPA